MSNTDTQKRGEEEGEVCNRLLEGGTTWAPKEHCKGIIALHPVEGCSCHIAPPCGACTTPREHCPECGWESKDEFKMNGFNIQLDRSTGTYQKWEKRPLDPTKIDYHIESHTNSSQKCVGVYPPGTTSAEVLKRVEGTFGGRFEYFRDGKFSYIAYTD